MIALPLLRKEGPMLSCHVWQCQAQRGSVRQRQSRANGSVRRPAIATQNRMTIACSIPRIQLIFGWADQCSLMIPYTQQGRKIDLKKEGETKKQSRRICQFRWGEQTTLSRWLGTSRGSKLQTTARKCHGRKSYRVITSTQRMQRLVQRGTRARKMKQSPISRQGCPHLPIPSPP